MYFEERNQHTWPGFLTKWHAWWKGVNIPGERVWAFFFLAGGILTLFHQGYPHPFTWHVIRLNCLVKCADSVQFGYLLRIWDLTLDMNRMSPPSGGKKRVILPKYPFKRSSLLKNGRLRHTGDNGDIVSLSQIKFVCELGWTLLVSHHPPLEVEKLVRIWSWRLGGFGSYLFQRCLRYRWW